MTSFLQRAIAAAVLAVATCCGSAARPADSIVKEQDGIRAELSVTRADVVLHWRFLKWLAQPITEVTATINGRLLGTPTIQPFSASGQRTAVVALLDVSGLDRKDDIERLKLAMLLLAARKAPHDQVAFAVYGLQAGLLAPQGDGADETIKLLAGFPALDDIGNLSGALISAMRTLERIPAERRAIFALTDGHNDSDIPLARLQELARTTGTAVTFLLAPSNRSADRPALVQLAEASGGQLVDEGQVGAFLAEPFALLDSGAKVQFPLESARRFFWESQSHVKVAVHYGTAGLEFDAEVPVAAASFNETTSFLLEHHRGGIFAAGGTAIALVGLGLLTLRRRARRPPARKLVPRSPRIRATLEDIEEGTRYPLNAPLVRIGRSGDNDIVLQAPTVGRFHAIVQQIGDAAYSITDQSSANGTLVNNQKVDTSTLCDGDVITLGAKHLRFNVA